MKGTYLAHKNDCSVIRNLKFYEHEAVLIDCDGEVLFSFPKDLTNNQIFKALEFANKAYSIGYKNGELSKINEIKTILNL